jgi:hypothetical protein
MLIDSDYDENDYMLGGSRAGRGERGRFPAVDGRTCRYLGWEYIDVKALGNKHNMLHGRCLDDRMYYIRPPKVAPEGYEALYG